MSKKKIFNDPIYGLVRFPFKSLYKIIDHLYFQRLRKISQQALSHYVYPGAMHTRFAHALGALHLMTRVVDLLRSKNVKITKQEYESVCIAILLHDVGHGPFSHALEYNIVNVNHEKISVLLLREIGNELGIDISMAIAIFNNQYEKKFLHQLVSGQIDVDRMDYLTRDSFYSGVAEGIIGYDRIIMMMNVKDNQLVIEEKGIYSIENFLVARRLMYLQVYLHKTVVAAEIMLIHILKRAKYLVQQGSELLISLPLLYFLKDDIVLDHTQIEKNFILNFVALDDTDIYMLIKSGLNSTDFVMKKLCEDLTNRKLFKTSKFKDEGEFGIERTQFIRRNKITEEEANYFFHNHIERLKFYNSKEDEIIILAKSGDLIPYSIINPKEIGVNELELRYQFLPPN